MAKKIALADASNADETEFRTLVAQVAPRLQTRWDIAPITEADLVVVDIDSVFGHMTWLKVMSLGKTVAAFTAHEPPKETDLVLRKPLDAQGVIDLFTQYQGGASAVAEPATRQAEPAAPRNTPPPPVASTKPAAAPKPAAAAPPAAPAPTVPPAIAPLPAQETTLIDFLTGSQLGGPARLSSEGAPDLILDPKSQSYHAAGTGLRALLPHCGRKLKVEDFHQITSADLDKARISAPAQPYARLLWFCTLNASHGHLLPGLDPNARYKLNRWPQIEREYAKHFRIATIMMKELATLTAIADGATAPLPDVVDFVNAYHAIGFVDSDMAKAGDAAADAKGGVLSRLRNPFAR
jgi:hypothetical protein